MEFLVDRAELADIEFIKELELSSGLSPWSYSDYAEEIGREDSIFLVIKSNSEPCGFLLARLIMTPTKHTNFFAEIYNIAVLKNYRRLNLGTTLLSTLITLGKTKGLVEIHLEVRKSNQEAIKFYQQQYFTKTGRRKNFYSNPTEDAILMSRKLT